MKFYSLAAGAAIACLSTSLAFAGGPDHMEYHHYPSPWHLDATVLGGFSYTMARAYATPFTTPATTSDISFTGATADFVAQLGASYNNLGFGATFESNNGPISSGTDNNNNVNTVKDLNSIGGYLSYCFMHMHRHSMTVIGTLTGTAWNIETREPTRGNNTYEASRYGVSEGVGLRYGYLVLPHMQLLAQMTTEFHQLNTTVSNSFQELRFRGNSAVSANFLAGVKYSFAM